VPKITQETVYGGALERAKRLGLLPVLDEIRQIASSFELLVLEKKDSNGGAAVRKLIDDRFLDAGGWIKKTSGGIDWKKSRDFGEAQTCVGVEVQFSARSDLVAMDIIHLRRALAEGDIDVGVILAPSDRLRTFLTDRAPAISDAIRHVRETRTDDLPLILIGIEHDGPGEALKKQAKRSSKSATEYETPPE